MARRIVIVVDDDVHALFRKFCHEGNSSMQREILNFILDLIKGEHELAREDNRDDN